jgi:hypothetical protein
MEDRDMWLVLCEDHDEAALWACKGLAARGLDAVELVTSRSLWSATRWVHRLGVAGSGLEVTLADGREICSGEVRGTLNRLLSAWSPQVDLARDGDREYAIQEIHAFYVSWLLALGGPMLNRPHMQGLSGRWRHSSEWLALGARAGLPARPRALDSDEPPPWTAPDDPDAQTVITAGGRVIGAPSADLVAGCRRLAELSGTPLLGTTFRRDGSGRKGWHLVGATPHPDLRLGGEPLLDALAAALSHDRDRIPT